jgi:outer membrane protein TolC
LGGAIEEEVEQAYSNWELAKKNLEVSETSLHAAQEMYELTRLQYEQGLTSYLFLQQKESSLTQAEHNRANALFNLRVSGARLEKAWGRRDW